MGISVDSPRRLNYICASCSKAYESNVLPLTVVSGIFRIFCSSQSVKLGFVSCREIRSGQIR